MKPLSLMLREGTMEAHKRAEASSFVRIFLQGKLPLSVYVEHLAMLETVYTALEESLDKHRDHPLVQPIYFPELKRVPALQQDLEFFANDRRPLPAPASKRYAKRISSLDSPALLAAHAYVRNLGDLSGGQALKRVAAKAYGLETDGLRFYEFTGIQDPGRFKDKYRQALDSIACSEQEKAAVVAEAAEAFHLNTEIFKDLETAAGKAITAEVPGES